MPTGVLAFATLTVGGLAALLVAEARGMAGLKWVAKPLASTGFLGVAVAAGALHTPYGRVLLAALALCWLGDVLLIPRQQASFRAGLASFLLGHLVLVVAFALRGVSGSGALLALAAVAPAAGLAQRWLAPHVPAPLLWPVRAYVAAISLMVVVAAGAAAAGAGLALLAGALLFYVSDLAVARDRFVAPGFTNRAWGLPLYYAATLLLASTAGAGGGAA